jgi:hypothetical protein
MRYLTILLLLGSAACMEVQLEEGIYAIDLVMQDDSCIDSGPSVSENQWDVSRSGKYYGFRQTENNTTLCGVQKDDQIEGNNEFHVGTTCDWQITQTIDVTIQDNNTSFLGILNIEFVDCYATTCHYRYVIEGNQVIKNPNHY